MSKRKKKRSPRKHEDRTESTEAGPGSSDQGQSFSPMDDSNNESASQDTSRAIDIGRPVSEEEYRRLKREAADGDSTPKREADEDVSD